MRTPTCRTSAAPALATALVAALLLAGCGGGADTAEPETFEAANGEEIARADVELASEMLKCHAESLALVDLTLGKQLDPELQALVEDLRAEHNQQVATLTTSLTDWGEEVPATVRDHVHAHDGDEAHAELEAAEGDRFAETWVPEMVAQLEDCAELAEGHDGVHGPTAELADTVAEGHEADIAALEELR